MAHRVTAPAMQRARRLLDQRVQPCVTHSSLSFEVFASEELFETVSYEKAIALSLSPFAIGTRWGKAWHTVWFKLVATVPANLAGQPLVAAIDLGFNGRGDGFQVEGLAYRHGKIVQAVQPDRRLVHLGSSAAGEVIELWVGPLQPRSLLAMHLVMGQLHWAIPQHRVMPPCINCGGPNLPFSTKGCTI